MFYSYALQHGLELLQEDKQWIAKITSGLSEKTVRGLLMPYINTWKKHMKLQPVEHKKQNSGRLYANSELREKI